MRFTAVDVMSNDKASTGLIGVPTHAEAPFSAVTTAYRDSDKDYLPGEGLRSLPKTYRKKENSTCRKEGQADTGLLAGANKPQHSLSGDGQTFSGRYHTGKEVRRALEDAQRYACEGRRWTVTLALDLQKSVADEKFRSRIAQIAYDVTCSKAFTSTLSKSLNVFSRARKGGKPSYGASQDSAVLFIRALFDEVIGSELLARGHRFVFCKDRIVVFLGSKASAERVSDSIARIVSRTLHGFVNRAQAQPRPLSQTNIFGLRIVVCPGGTQVRVHDDLLHRIKTVFRHITARSRGVAFAQRLREARLAVALYGALLNMADDAAQVVYDLNDWLSSRYRLVLWKQWKLVRSRISGLEAVGIGHDRAVKLGSAHLGLWSAATSEGLQSALSYSALRKKGFSFFSYGIYR